MPLCEKNSVMKKVLFIAYYFPPMGGSGVQRSIKYAKHLVEFGFQPIVITVNSKFTRWAKDTTLLKEIPEQATIYRSFTIDLNWFYKIMWGFRLPKLVEWLQINVFIPDSESTWLPFAKKKIDNILKHHAIDLVYITGPPFSSMLLGPYIQKRHNLPYVLDFRDEWTNNPYINDGKLNKSSIVKNKELEKQCLENCSAIVYTHPKFMKESFESSYPFLQKKIHRIITNGFDEDDFSMLNVADKEKSKKLRIVYTGAFYGRRKPEILWDVLVSLSKTGVIDKDWIEIKIVGKNTRSFVMGEYAGSKPLEEMVNFTEQKNYGEAISELFSADLLLLYIAPGYNCQAEMPGKVFEYMRSYKPILAVVPPEGAAADILRQSRTAFICDSSDVDDVKSIVTEVYKLWETNKLYVQPDKDYISRYNRRFLTRELASLFNEVIAKFGKGHG
jgi:glycosyltransferase involved in cell wall biosynthesis